MAFPLHWPKGPRPNPPRIEVPFNGIYDANTGRWKVQPAQFNPTIVTFDLHPQFVEGIQPGCYDLLVST